MKRIQFILVGFIAVLTALWWLADTLWPQPLSYFAFRTVFMQYSGVIAIGAMSLAMLLALRPTWLEPQLDGLDKMYRLHKWLGITRAGGRRPALVVGAGHEVDGRLGLAGSGPHAGPAAMARRSARSKAGCAASAAWPSRLGEWAFYAAAVLIVLALVQRFPYHLFARPTSGWRRPTWCWSFTRSY